VPASAADERRPNVEPSRRRVTVGAGPDTHSCASVSGAAEGTCGPRPASAPRMAPALPRLLLALGLATGSQAPAPGRVTIDVSGDGKLPFVLEVAPPRQLSYNVTTGARGAAPLVIALEGPALGAAGLEVPGHPDRVTGLPERAPGPPERAPGAPERAPGPPEPARPLSPRLAASTLAPEPEQVAGGMEPAHAAGRAV
jgi:hypothetical protein